MASFQQYMRDEGYITPEHYKQVQNLQAQTRNITFYTALKKSKILDDEQLIPAACSFFNFKRVKNPFHIDIDFVFTAKITENVFRAIELRTFVCRQDGKLTCVLSDPENEALKAKANSVLGGICEFALITEEEFSVIHQYHLRPRAITEQSDKIKGSVAANQGDVTDGQTASLTQGLLDMLIDSALSHRASDLHLQPLNDDHAQVVLRIDGKLHHYANIKSDILNNLRNKLRTMSKVGGESIDKPVEGQIRVDYRGTNIDVRINIVRSRLGFDFNLRFIDSSLKSLEELGLTEQNYEYYMQLLHRTKGLIILCGPTGSGKTSLLYAGFKKLLAENKGICTIEDPVEIIMPGMTQLEVKTEKGMSYETLFPSVLRHDPDIIGIGEIRSHQVADQTVQAANTGHLVFTTIHTNDAIGAVPRITGLGIDPYMLGDTLSAVIAQRLVRRVCTECCEEYELEADSPWRERYKLGDGIVRLKRGVGCAHCAGTGFYGRTAVNEFMIATPALKEAIQKGATRYEMEKILKEEKYQTYLEDAITKAQQGITTFDEVDELFNDYPGAQRIVTTYARKKEDGYFGQY